MAQSLSDIVLHIVFSTKDRKPWIHPDIETPLFSFICGVARELKSPIININSVQYHVHILLHLARTISTGDLIAKIKSNSSRWIKSKGDQYSHFSWQSGYAAFSVSRPIIEGAVKYICRQKEHHQTVSFKEEFLNMLKRAQIQYDEKYLWE